MKVTIEELYDIIQKFVDNHVYLNSMNYKEYHDNITSFNDFPVLWMQAPILKFNENTTEFKLRVVILDRLDNDANIARVMSDTAFALEDLVNYFQNNNEDLQIWIQNPTDNVKPLFDEIPDHIGGFGGVFTFITPSGKDYNALPLN